MDRRITLVVGLAVGIVLFMFVRQQKILVSEARAAQAWAEEERLRAEQALGQDNKTIAEARQPRWEYQVLSIAGSDEAVNQVLGKLTDDRWEYVGVMPPGSEPERPYARMLFKRMKRAAKR